MKFTKQFSVTVRERNKHIGTSIYCLYSNNKHVKETIIDIQNRYIIVIIRGLLK